MARRRLLLLVGLVDLVGLALFGAVAALLPTTPPGISQDVWWLSGPFVIPVLIGLSCLGELAYVPLRHKDAVEELALFEAAVVVDALLLPGWQAVLVAAAGLFLASVVRRRPPVKALFNLGTYTAATAVLVLLVHLGGVSRLETFSLSLVLTLIAGTVAFALVNLAFLARVLWVATGADPSEVVATEWRLSGVMAIGTAALGSTAVALAAYAPALLPFALLPAGTLFYAYRARAHETDEHERSSRLLALSEVLAGRLDPDELASTFVLLAVEAFAAEEALVVLAPERTTPEHPGDPQAEPRAVAIDEVGVPDDALRPATAEEAALLDLAWGGRGAALVHGGLPRGWARAVVAPLEAEGRRLGAVVLATRRRNALGERDVTLLTPIASALAVALRGADHLGRLVEETGKLKAVVEHSSDGILVLDAHGLVLLWSPALEIQTGRSAADAVGHRLADVMPAFDASGTPVDPFEVGLSGLSEAAPRTAVELGLRRSDGEERWSRLSHTAVYERGVLVRDVVIVHDITKERQVDRLKTDFIATVSHELRTPVTPIKGYAELLRRRGDAMTPEKRSEALDFIVERTTHLARLVEDLLLASRVSSSSGPRHHVRLMDGELVALTRRAVGDFDADSARLHLSVPDEPVPVSCDPVRTVQVLTNLVGNALKYSAPGTPVDVRLEVTDEVARVAVTDRGRGIPADQLDQVFEKFHRVEDPLRMTTSGTGLGLFIARELAEAMGGGISVVSTLGVGSTFTFQLPLLSDATVEPAEDDPAALPVGTA